MRRKPPTRAEFSAFEVDWCSEDHPSVHHTTDAEGDDGSGAVLVPKASNDAVDENNDKDSPALLPLMLLMLLLLLLLLFPIPGENRFEGRSAVELIVRTSDSASTAFASNGCCVVATLRIDGGRCAACDGFDVGESAAARARAGDASCSEAALATCEMSVLGRGELGRPVTRDNLQYI